MNDAPVVTVFGATGKTGRAVIAAARRHGWRVRAVSRRVSPPEGPGDAGVEFVRADVVTGDGVADAVAGADAVHLVVPNLQPREAEAAERVGVACARAGVPRLVYHSVADPDDARMPHHLRKHDAEQALRRVRDDVVVLRPCAYQENLLSAAIAGRIEVPYDLDVPFSLVALADVAEATVRCLAADAPGGVTYDLGGPQALSVGDLAAEASQVLRRDVEAVAVGVESWRARHGAGLSPAAVEELVAMFRAYDESGFVVNPAPLTDLLARRPTTWAQTVRGKDAA